MKCTCAVLYSHPWPVWLYHIFPLYLVNGTIFGKKDVKIKCVLIFTIHHFSGLGSVVSIATGYRLDGPGIESRWEARFSAPVQTSPGAHPASCTMGTGSFQRVKSGRGVTLTPHPLLLPWSWKSRAIPLLPVWAVPPVQSLSACTRGAFYLFFFFYTYSPHPAHLSASSTDSSKAKNQALH